MPVWVNVKHRMPVKTGKYFTKVNGMKDVLFLHEIEKKTDWDYDVFWLDESDVNAAAAAKLNGCKTIEEMVAVKYGNDSIKVIVPPLKKNDVVGAIRNNQTLSNYAGYLESLFGVKKTKKILGQVKS